MLEGKKWNKKKKDWKKINECFGADYFVGKNGGKGLTRNFKKSSKMKWIISNIFQTKKTEKETNKRTEKERKLAEREEAEDVFTNLCGEQSAEV